MRCRWLFVTLLLTACGDEEEPFIADVHFSSCSFVTDGTDSDAECARVRVPVAWDELDGDTLELFVKRRRGDGGSHGQLWLLAGGPGVDGAFFEPIIHHFLAARDDLDIYIVDHRGTGRSSRLECPAEEASDSPGGTSVTAAELDSCLAYLTNLWGSELARLNPTEAARDVAGLIDALDDGSEVFVYGRSYGTYLLHRYLQVAPSQATGVVFDSICGPTECRFPVFYDVGHDEAGRALLQRCAADGACNGYLSDPQADLVDLYADLDAGHCATLGWESWLLRGILSTMVRDVYARQFIPATIHRLRRCNGSDRDALGQLLSAVYSPSSLATERLRSLLLRSHIVHSELWRDATSAEEQQINAALFVGGALATMPGEHEDWPVYQPGALAAELADSDVPILMMHGGLDPQTPPAVTASLRNHFVGAHQTFVDVPLSPHGIINSSVIPGAGGQTCGEVLLGDFLANPMTPPNDACAAMAASIDFSADASAVFGRADPWN